MTIKYSCVFVDKKLIYEYPKDLKYQTIINLLKIKESSIISSGKEFIFVKKDGIISIYCISTVQDSNVWNFLEKVEELYKRIFDFNQFMKIFEEFNLEQSKNEIDNEQFYESQAKKSKKSFYLKILFGGFLILFTSFIVLLIIIFLACGFTFEKCK